MNFREELCKEVHPHGYPRAMYISYDMTCAFWHRRRDKRGSMRKLGRTEIIRKDDGVFHFHDSYYGVTYASLAPDDTVTVMHTKPHVGTQQLEHMISAVVYSKSQVNIKHRLRCRMHSAAVKEGESWHSPAFPLVPGLQFRHGEVLNRELAVDYVRKSVPEVRRAWTKLFAPWSTLMKALAKLDPDALKIQWFEFDHAILNNEPNAEDAATIVGFGLGRGRRFWYGKRELTQDHCENAIRYMSKYLREAYYETHNGWVWVKKGGEEKS